MASEVTKAKNECGLSLQGHAEHREWIGGRVLTLLGHYWRDDDPVELTAAIARDWADILAGLPQDVIQKACVQYARDEPRRKPTPGAIYQLARTFMPHLKPVEASRPATRAENEAIARDIESKRMVNHERAAKAQEILNRAGFSKRIGGGDD